jgi:hypothetical protein
MGETKEKQTLNIPLSLVKLLATLWVVYVSIHSFLLQLPERKETTLGFHHEANGDFKTVIEFNSCEERKRKMDQQHCSSSTILT